MTRALTLGSTIVVAVALSLAACKKGEDKAAAPVTATVNTGVVGADGVRSIPVAVNEKGYSPESIPGKPGEKLSLVFTRTIEGECLSELKTPEGKLVPLPMNKPVAVAITVPASGELTFACGMDMFRGKIVATGG